MCQDDSTWFCKTYYSITSDFVPKREPTPEEKEKKTDMSHAYDYGKIIDLYEQGEVKNPEYFPKDLNIIVDEGQDLSPGYYETLYALGCENIFVTADQNQQIRGNENSNIEELSNILDVKIPLPDQVSKKGEVIYLKENFRTTTPIARFCNYFYTDKSSPAPEIPDRPSVDIPILYRYDSVINCVKMILREADSDPSLLIGVIVATETKRESYCKLLRSTVIDRDNETPSVSTYGASQKQNVEIDFSKGGVIVLCDKSVKGIEFDSTYIILDGLKMINDDKTLMKKRLFVMSSRPKNRLVLFQGVSCDEAVRTLMPKDEKLLKMDTL